MNRLALQESVAQLAPHDLIELAAAAGFDSIGLRVAHSAGADRWWRKGAGAAELHSMIDALLVRRVSVLDVGRIELATDDDETTRHVLDLASRLGSRYVTAAGGDGAADAFGRLVAQADAYGLVPLLVPQPGSGLATEAQASAVPRVHGGGVVLAVSIADDAADIETRVVDAGNRLGYVRLLADELATADEPAVAGLLATVPVHVPIAVGAQAPVTVDVATAARWRHLVDRMLEHPRARAAREGR